MKTILLTLVVFCAINLSGLAQPYVISELNTWADLTDQLTLKKGRAGGLIDPSIDGTPYLSDDFIEGDIIINDSLKIEKVPLRYNLYSDKIEFKTDDDEVLEISDEKSSYQFDFDDFIFKNLDYLEYGETVHGMLELLVDGDFKLYKKYKLELKPATKAIGFQDAQPNRFVRMDNVYLIETKQDEIPRVFTNTKILLRELKEVKPDIDSIIKKEKIRVKTESGLCKLIRLCNE